MKKNSSCPKSSKPVQRAKRPRKVRGITVGVDLGDKNSRYCMLDRDGNCLQEGTVGTNKKSLTQLFATLGRCLVALEVGTHSPWVSRLISRYGHEVIVANPRQLKLITQSSRKDDRVDAEMLARIARVDPRLLRPIQHRSEEAQADLARIRVRAALLEARTSLVSSARGQVKSLGERLPNCDADQMGVKKAESLPSRVRDILRPLLEAVESLTDEIQQLDQELEQIARERYPETALLQQICGVGVLIALTFILTIGDCERFQKSREVGPYLGLRPKRSNSGERELQLRITKEGDPYLRKLLVQGAHCIMSKRAPDTDLKRWGEKLCQRGGKNARKRALVAVARKLAVLLHALWASGEVYEPLRNSLGKQRAAA